MVPPISVDQRLTKGGGGVGWLKLDNGVHGWFFPLINETNSPCLIVNTKSNF